ncbi:MAG: spermidine synthase, partial [Chloroflexota bacterium]
MSSAGAASGATPAAGVAGDAARPRTVRALADTRVRLVLTSATLLFVELLFIRWIPSEVRYVGFFSNFLLMASFLGIGIGILLGRRQAIGSIAWFPILLAIVVLLVTRLELNVQVRSQDELFFGLAESHAADVNFLVLPLVFGLVVAVMASLAVPLGPLLRSGPPLQVYAFDIAGSMMGILAFTALSAAGTPPVVWFTVVAVLVLLLIAGTGMGRARFGAYGGLLLVIVLVGAAQAKGGGIWSPYYRIDTYTATNNQLAVNVNGIPHQTLHAVNGPQEEFYKQVYRWFPDRQFGNVLVVGAGTGTDTAIALDRGADHVDAVEIDPAILRIGVEEHPDHPYQDPRVRTIENDGRAFLRGTDARYDLVIFALPDSLTLVSSTANIRLESFLLTEESFKSVRDHLTPSGVFILYNYYREPWLIAKIADMLESSFGAPPIVR